MTQLAHGKKLEPLAESVRRLVLYYKKHIKTITPDNDPEFATHKFITKSLGAFIYCSLCLIAKGSDRKHKQTHQTIYLSPKKMIASFPEENNTFNR